MRKLKPVLSFLLMLTLVLGLVPTGYLEEAPPARSLRVHYQNAEDAYEDLGIWFWGDVVTPSEKTGAWPNGRSLLTLEDSGAYLDIELLPDDAEIGVLVIAGTANKLTPEA